MDTDAITPEIIKRICNHMNKQHSESLVIYASKFAGFTNPNEIELLQINSISMKLRVDNQLIEIPFDHILIDSKDAHKTLVEMSQSK